MKGNIVIYSRKSRFTGKGESIGNQTELCREYIKFHFGEEALEETFLYEDEGFSGGNLKRPGLDRKSTRLNSSHSGESRMPSSA